MSLCEVLGGNLVASCAHFASLKMKLGLLRSLFQTVLLRFTKLTTLFMNNLRSVRYFALSAVFRKVRFPRELIRHPNHRSYEQTEFPMGSMQDMMKNAVTTFPKRLSRPIVPVQYLFEGDFVFINHGPDEGKRGVIAQVLQKESKVIVTGRNCGWEMNQMEQLEKFEKPLLMQHVSLIDPYSQEPNRIEFRVSVNAFFYWVDRIFRTRNLLVLSTVAAMNLFLGPEIYFEIV